MTIPLAYTYTCVFAKVSNSSKTALMKDVESCLVRSQKFRQMPNICGLPLHIQNRKVTVRWL